MISGAGLRPLSILFDYHRLGRNGDGRGGGAIRLAGVRPGEQERSGAGRPRPRPHHGRRIQNSPRPWSIRSHCRPRPGRQRRRHIARRGTTNRQPAVAPRCGLTIGHPNQCDCGSCRRDDDDRESCVVLTHAIPFLLECRSAVKIMAKCWRIYHYSALPGPFLWFDSGGAQKNLPSVARLNSRAAKRTVA